MKKKLATFLGLLMTLSCSACGMLVNSSSDITSDTSLESTSQSSSEQTSQSSSEQTSSSTTVVDRHPLIGTKETTAIYVSTAPVIDGERDAAYDAYTPIEIVEPNEHYWDEYPYSEGGKAWVLYDDEYVYIYVEVIDYNSADTTNNVVWRKDCLGVMLDFAYYREKNEYSDWDELKEYIGYVNIGADNTYEYYNAYTDSTLADRIEHSTIDTADGYAYEMRLPILESFDGEKIGFELLLNDAVNGDRFAVYSWNEDGSQIYKYTHVAGTLYFGEKE